MGRNYFSKAGGPYFINDGFSHHTDHDHETGHNHNDIKPDPNLLYGLTLALVSLILTIGITLRVLS